MSNTTIRVVTETEEFKSLAGGWDSLLQKCGDDNSIYLTHEWLSTWWRYFGERKKLNILLIEKEHQLIGIVPLMKTEYKIGLIKLDTLETVGAINCNYVGLLLPENREEAISILLAYLEKELAKNKIILRLALVPEDSKFLDVLRRKGSQFSKSLVIQEKVTTSAPYIALTTTWDEYFDSLSRNRRRILRRTIRSLEEAHRVGFQEYTADSLEEGLNRLFDLHQRRWQSVNVKSMFYNPKVREFYKDIANQFLKKNWLHFSCLTADNEVVSALYGFIYNRKFYALISARDTRHKYSVGHLHYMYLIKGAIKKGLQEFDFLRGGEPYKFHWAKSLKRYTRVKVIKKGFWPSIRLKYLQAFLRLHEIRQYSLKEIYYLLLLKRREMKERKKMGL